MRKMLRHGALLALFAGLFVGSARAENWPVRSVTMIVPFPAGGSADTLARAVAQELSDKLGKPFVIDNRAGEKRIAVLFQREGQTAKPVGPFSTQMALDPDLIDHWLSLFTF